ncbi:MAG: type II toxin-antitoxin system VapC family toxin [Caulobacteraceae bacterium]
MNWKAMTEFVLDSSAVLADLRDEPGAAVVRSASPTSYLSAVNYAEIITKLIEAGTPPDSAGEIAEQLGYTVVVADQERAASAGKLHAKTRRTGVSIGDRFCLALAQELSLPALTGDRRWKSLDLGVEVTLIR